MNYRHGCYSIIKLCVECDSLNDKFATECCECGLTLIEEVVYNG